MPCSRQSCFQNSIPIWFPHCPTWIVMISRGIFFSPAPAAAGEGEGKGKGVGLGCCEDRVGQGRREEARPVAAPAEARVLGVCLVWTRARANCECDWWRWEREVTTDE